MINRAILNLGFCLLLLACMPAWADVAGTINYLTGTLAAKNAGGVSRLLAEKSEFNEGDVLTTSQNSYARLKFVDGAEIIMRPNSVLDIKTVKFQEAEPSSDSFAVGLLKGGMRAVTGLIGKRNKERVNYGTPAATIGIRGTHFGLLFCQDDCQGEQSQNGNPLSNGLHADVADGSIELGNKAGSLIVDKGHFAYVADENTKPESADNDPYRVEVPASTMFDENAEVWSEGIKCATCSLH
jgi:FecR protein